MIAPEDQMMRSLVNYALVDLRHAYKPDAIVDFLNPFACIAAWVARKKLIRVIQSDMHSPIHPLSWKPALKPWETRRYKSFSLPATILCPARFKKRPAK